MKIKTKHIVLLLVFCVPLVLLLSLSMGNIFISPLKIIEVFLSQESDALKNILLYARIPRTFASFFSGVALAVSGAVLQNVLSNPLCSPSIIGVNAGAGLGLALASLLGVFSGFMLSFYAFLGSLVAVLLISLLAYKGGVSKSMVILGGVALNSILHAITEGIGVLNTDVLTLHAEFRVGGFSALSYDKITAPILLILFGFFVLLSLSKELDIMHTGDEFAHGLGLSVKKYRLLFLALSALLAGSAVSFSGLLGFVGLLVPHFVKKITHLEAHKALPLTALLGGCFVTLSDLVARVLFLPYELPVGIILSVIGAPLFVYILLKKGRM